MMSIDYIDAIARKKGRDVLYVTFFGSGAKQSRLTNQSSFDWENLPVRNGLIEWLTRQGIDWFPCAGIANLNTMEAYRGGLYVDLAIDEQSPEYRAFLDYVEFPDGTPRTPVLKAYICALADAKINSAHDVPGFWEQWAATF